MRRIGLAVGGQRRGQPDLWRMLPAFFDAASNTLNADEVSTQTNERLRKARTRRARGNVGWHYAQYASQLGDCAPARLG